MSDGATLREHLESVKAQTGVAPPQLEEAENTADIPYQVAHLLYWFNSLNLGRTGSGFGQNPLTYTEIRAWSQLQGMELTPFEVECLKDMDIIYLAESAKIAKAQQKAQKKGK